MKKADEQHGMQSNDPADDSESNDVFENPLAEREYTPTCVFELHPPAADVEDASTSRNFFEWLRNTLADDTGVCNRPLSTTARSYTVVDERDASAGRRVTTSLAMHQPALPFNGGGLLVSSGEPFSGTGITRRQDISDGNTVPISMIFYRLRNLGKGNCQSPHTTTARPTNNYEMQWPRVADNPCSSAFQSPMLTLNHMYLCMDVKHCSIRPTIKAVKLASKLGVNNQNLESMSSQTRVSGDTPSYIDLGNCDQIYHWIGSLCPDEGDHPCFLQLYVYDTHDEVNNRMQHFGGLNEGGLNPDIFEGFIHVLDEHNGLVRLFRTARDKYNVDKRPGFKIRLYSMGGVRGYELPTSDIIGGIVFEDGPRKPGFYPELTLKPQNGKGKGKKVTMNAYYKYQLHTQVKEFGLILRGGRLCQQYVVAVFCAIELSRLDFIRKKQNDLQSDYLSGLYDAISRGDREGIVVGSKIMLPNTFTRGPRDFEQKVKDFIKFLKTVRTFGYISAVLYTIELQKRGLPHCHTLLWVDYKSELQDMERIDEFISAEIPDPVEDPRGPDRILAKISDSKASASLPGNSKQIDEIQSYILSVHLENMQRVNFHKRDRLDVIVNLPDKKKTTLTKWFVYNNENTDGRHLTYLNFPSEFMWYSNSKEWKRRVVKTKKSLGRLIYIHPSSGELFYFRMLLCHQKGCRSPVEATGIPNYFVNIPELQEYILYELEAMVNGFGKRCFETLDRTLRDLMDASRLLFGGKTVVLGGDFCQTLPVKKGAGKDELIAASIAESHLWWHFKVCTLKENMRLISSDLTTEKRWSLKAFANWLLDVDNDEIGDPDEEDGHNSSWITIPSDYLVVRDERGLSELIDFIYDDTTLRAPDNINN
nr:DNA helicase [Tanacetum cinerariifolium]